MSLVKFFVSLFVVIFLKIKENKFKIDKKKQYRIILSHDRKGGTFFYEHQNFISEECIIVRRIFSCNDFFYKLETLYGYKIITEKKLFCLLNSINISEIIISSFVSYRNLEVWKNWINIQTCKVKYLVHDFHSICMNYTLIMNKKYCELNCSHCELKEKKSMHNKLFSEIFSKCDEIVCFSDSSKKILLSIYDNVKNKIIVIPHSMSYCNFEPLEIGDFTQNIAIIGNCSSIAKGKFVIKKLIPVIKKRKDRILYVIGKKPSNFCVSSKFVKFTGAYNLSDLPKILKERKIKIVVFTSILPETFSYAISEFMKLGLNIVALDLGAQGDKLRDYERAVFINDLEPKSILDGIDRCVTMLKTKTTEIDVSR